VRINRMTANHYRGTADFYIDQTDKAAKVLWQIIEALDLKPMPDALGEVADDDVLLFGMYRASDVIATIRERCS
jgi:hypothetical protein